ncbi:MAG: PKD domain-containing protein [Bacteroidota bacterium]|nr:PKD domain-containing protein [Bacteroidota bacterium]
MRTAVSHDVTIHPLPIANFTYDTPICQDGEAQFTDLSSTASGYITQWVWDYGDGTSDTINFPENPNPVHVYDTSGTFTVHLWVITTDSCEAEAEKTITVDAAPIADWEYEGGCADEMVQFTDLSTPVGAPISEWYWDFGDPVSGQNNYSTAQNPQHLFSSAGTFTVTLIVVNTSGCSDTLAQDVSVTPLPAVGFNGLCRGLPGQ